MDSGIRAGIELALADYPLIHRRKGEVSYDCHELIRKVAVFLVYANGVVLSEGVLHDAERMDPHSLRPLEGRLIATAVSSCGVPGTVRAVEMHDVLNGVWCEKCFPDAKEVQRLVRGE